MDTRLSGKQRLLPTRNVACQVLLLLMPLAMLAGCGQSSARSATAGKSLVRVAKPIERMVTDYVYFTGRMDAVESIDIQSRVTGYLQTIDFKPGTEVKAGQQLFLIDPRPYQATLDETMGQVKLAEAQLQLAVADYQRAIEVARTPGAISKQDIDKYAAAQSEAAASVEAAKANSESAALNLEFTKITTLIDGRVGRNLITAGNLVKQDTTLLTTVVSQDPMYAYFDVDEHTMLRIQKMIREGKIRSVRQGAEMPIQMGLANEGTEYPHQGKVDFVNNTVDPSTGTLQVRGTFANPLLGDKDTRLLSPGLFVRVRVPLGKPFQALLLPQAAVSTDQGLKYLMVVNSQGVIEYRPVTLGPEQPGGLQVIYPQQMVRNAEGVFQLADSSTPEGTPTVESLTAQDNVIISGLQMVRPGMTVETREVSITPGPLGTPTDADSPLTTPSTKPADPPRPTIEPNQSEQEPPAPMQTAPAANVELPATPVELPAEPALSDPPTLPEANEPLPANTTQQNSDAVFEPAPAAESPKVKSPPPGNNQP